MEEEEVLPSIPEQTMEQASLTAQRSDEKEKATETMDEEGMLPTIPDQTLEQESPAIQYNDERSDSCSSAAETFEVKSAGEEENSINTEVLPVEDNAKGSSVGMTDHPQTPKEDFPCRPPPCQ